LVHHGSMRGSGDPSCAFRLHDLRLSIVWGPGPVACHHRAVGRYAVGIGASRRSSLCPRRERRAIRHPSLSAGDH
jgi:hypothetical protein